MKSTNLHFGVSMVSRKDGRNACAKASYNSDEKITDFNTGG